MYRSKQIVWRALAGIAILLAPTSASAHIPERHGPIPTRPPSLACSHEGCIFGDDGQMIDGFLFSASSAPSTGSYGWWHHVSYQPPSTTFRVRACVGTIPFRSDDCGPAAEMVTPRPRTVPELIDVHFGAAAPKARDVAWCESRYDPKALSSGGHVGVFQLSRVHEGRANRLGYSWSEMYEAEPNIVVARDLQAEQGWRPWSCA